MAKASSLVTDSMSALGLTTAELPAYLDIVAQTARSSNTDIDQMAEAYLKVGGTLRGLGVPLEELGFSAFDSGGNFKGLENILFDLKDKLSGMTEEQRSTYLAMVGGKEHVKDLNALLNGLDE